MDELTIDGKTYISSKKAAVITGYAKDYVGQLCREGRVEARLVGRSWYVYEPSLSAHRFEDGRKSEHADEAPKEYPNLLGGAPAASEEEGYARGETELHGEVKNGSTSDNASIQAVWEPLQYVSEAPVLIPSLPEKDEKKETIQNEERLSEMQSAWQEWFSMRKEEVPAEKPKAQPLENPVSYTVKEEPAPVAVRRIVSDIAPVRPVEHAMPRSAAPTLSPAPKPLQRPAPKAQTPAVRRVRKGSRRGESSVVLRALIIGCIVLVASIALIGTGIIGELHIGTFAENDLFRFFEGTTEIK